MEEKDLTAYCEIYNVVDYLNKCLLLSLLERMKYVEIGERSRKIKDHQS